MSRATNADLAALILDTRIGPTERDAHAHELAHRILSETEAEDKDYGHKSLAIAPVSDLRLKEAIYFARRHGAKSFSAMNSLNLEEANSVAAELSELRPKVQKLADAIGSAEDIAWSMGGGFGDAIKSLRLGLERSGVLPVLPIERPKV